jgi:hypothetical protein
VILVVTWRAYGCPLQAIVQAFGFDERTVNAWQSKAGAHGEQGHTALVTEPPMHLQQGQAHEIRVKWQPRLVVGMALALCADPPLAGRGRPCP